MKNWKTWQKVMLWLGIALGISAIAYFIYNKFFAKKLTGNGLSKAKTWMPIFVKVGTYYFPTYPLSHITEENFNKLTDEELDKFIAIGNKLKIGLDAGKTKVLDVITEDELKFYSDVLNKAVGGKSTSGRYLTQSQCKGNNIWINGYCYPKGSTSAI